ncbi:MAG TPA: YbaY family lipoprotein [Pyrinomonadaceae bacterium]|nr:YbaY family lipoprotein [Pyrinomonadaceae bacterium]
MAETNTVRGQVVLPNVELPNQTADLIVQVEDVSRADAPSQVVGEQRVSGVQISPGQVLPFEIEIPTGQVDPNRSYSVRAHVDMTGSGKVETGDLITTQSYPVLTQGYGNEANVTVKRI